MMLINMQSKTSFVSVEILFVCLFCLFFVCLFLPKSRFRRRLENKCSKNVAKCSILCDLLLLGKTGQMCTKSNAVALAV